MNIKLISNRLVEHGEKLFDDPKQLDKSAFTTVPEADVLLKDLEKHPHAFVLACVMDRQVKTEKAWIPYVPKKPLALEYKGCPLRSTYEPDFICYDKIVLELKAVTELADEHRAQVQNYLKATGLKLGLLVNFGHYPKTQVERIAAERGRYEHKA